MSAEDSALLRTVLRRPVATARSVLGRRRGSFYLITGSGHSGTSWLARALTRPRDRMVCYHELKVRSAQVGWNELLAHELEHGISGIYEGYIRSLERSLRIFSGVGDANSWTMYLVPELAHRLPIDCIIYLVRNGIQTVHSCHASNRLLPPDDTVYSGMFERYGQLMSGIAALPAMESAWEHWCFWWRLNLHLPAWLQEQLPETRLITVRLEDLLSATASLADLIRSVNPDARIRESELDVLRDTDVNRKVSGQRSPEFLWSSWAPQQRETFLRFCAPAMEHFGYEIPSA